MSNNEAVLVMDAAPSDELMPKLTLELARATEDEMTCTKCINIYLHTECFNHKCERCTILCNLTDFIRWPSAAKLRNTVR